MRYSEKARERADAVLSSYRRRAEQLRLEKSQEIYEKIPEIKEIDDSIVSLGIKTTSLALKRKLTPDEAYEELTKNLSALKERKKILLKESGFPANYLNEVFHCANCKDTGILNNRTCDCVLKIMSEYDLSLNNKKSFADFNLELYSKNIDTNYNTSPHAHMEKVLDYCIHYANTFSVNSPNLLMYGGAGLGKTFLCNCIASELASKGFNVIFRSAYNIFELISKDKFDFKENLSFEVARFYDCDLLIMDDLGTEFSTEYTVSALFDIINQRMNKGLPTIINANLSFKDMEKHYSDRILSRILTFKHLLFFGADIRSLSLG